MDLGADTFRTFRLVTFPQLRSALLAGALLAFALSFDEIVVTTFTTSAGLRTVPIWVFENLFRPNAAPVVNVVAAALIVASVLPIWAAQRLSGERGRRPALIGHSAGIAPMSPSLSCADDVPCSQGDDRDMC